MTDRKSESSEDEGDILDLKNDEGCKYLAYVFKVNICASPLGQNTISSCYCSLGEMKIVSPD